VSGYTYRDRQRSIATRRRNARLRREEIAKLGYNPNNPTVKLADNLVVTQAVENRLSNRAKSKAPIAGVLVFIWVLTFFFISRFSISEWSLVPIILALVLTVFILYIQRALVKADTIQLAEERKNRLDETKQFYSSPEWSLIRKQIIDEKGRVCSECGKRIRKSNDVTVDHILPRSKYPSLALEKNNLCVLCRSCNSRKSDRDPDKDSELLAFEAEPTHPTE